MTKKSARRTHHAPHFYAIFAVIAIAIGVFGTVVITKVLAQTGEIFACAAQSTGLLRLIGATDSCRPNETSVSWNKEGPAGPPGPGGSQETHTKTLTNNSNTDLFSFPLADGDLATFIFSFGSKIKKGSDWGTAVGLVAMQFYNNGGTLQKTFTYPTFDNLGPLNLNTSSTPFNASLSSEVLTVTANLGNVVADPDSYTIEYILENHEDKPITFLP